MNYEIVIGLEVHLQSKTQSKMFCRCSSQYFGAEPNTHTCPVCLGLPGALPVPNKKAIELCVKLALALNCYINEETKFDRKNYYYPDLPKGYQISQYDLPIGHDGKVTVELKDGTKEIRVKRVHQEEDTGKSVHQGNITLLDYNKSGVALIEIVTEPDFHSTEEVKIFADNLRQIVRYLDISDADMEKGQMRFELNMSLRPVGQKELPNYKVEVKNIGSISVLEKVIDTEIIRQSELLDSGITPDQETRGLVNMNGKTRSQRKKETESDYRYFPEPDIPPFYISKADQESIRRSMPELPEARRNRYIEYYGLDKYTASVITSEKSLAEEFDNMVIASDDKELISQSAKWLIGENLAMNAKQSPASGFTTKWIKPIVSGLREKKYTKETAVEIFRKAYTTGIDPTSEIQNMQTTIVSDQSQILEVIKTVIAQNEKAVADFKSGKNPNAMMFIIGQTMKALAGKGDISVVKELVAKELQ